MGQSLSKLYVHVVFSTKNRHQCIDPLIQPRLHAYLADAFRGQGCEAYRVGGVNDHIHACVDLGRTVALSDVLEVVKGESSKWMKKRGVEDFYWQKGYGGFSISPQHKDAVIQYIANQDEHHKSESFQDEFRRLCRKYEVDLDERYVWT